MYYFIIFLKSFFHNLKLYKYNIKKINLKASNLFKYVIIKKKFIMKN